MKERPILFTGEMVRAILDGRKTQTRRVITDQSVISLRPDGTPGKVQPRCKYGQLGDRLWVRETWAQHPEVPGQWMYRADRGGDYQGAAQGDFKWIPSIHMIRRASRITLEIESVRVERVQEITNQDAKQEGLPSAAPHRHGRLGIVKDFEPPDPYAERHHTGINDCWICAFRVLWNSINLKRGFGWESNPWVWAITFRRVK